MAPCSNSYVLFFNFWEARRWRMMHTTALERLQRMLWQRVLQRNRQSGIIPRVVAVDGEDGAADVRRRKQI